MAHTLYNEVTAVTGTGYPTNRVLGTLKSASLNLPYSLEDIKISHNDFAVTEVYNDSIRKLYSNYLYLIANAELVTTSSPISSVDYYINVDPNFTATLSSTSTSPASGNSLSSIHDNIETYIAKKRDSNNFVYFTYSKGDSVVVESTTDFGTIKSVLSGNFVEHGQKFKFKDVVSVDVVDEFLFVLDRGNLTLFKFDISGLLTNDPAIRRLGADDTDNPGRLLLKTLGGTQYTQVKNRLIEPVSISIHDKLIYILDNGTRSIKVYDLNFNYIKDIVHNPMYDELQNDVPVSFVIDQLSDTDETIRGYILTSKGKIFEYNPAANRISRPISLFETYLPYEIYVFDENRLPPTADQEKLYKPEGSNFKKIVNCKSSKNILYIATNRNIYKLYKTSLDTPITILDFNTSVISDGNSRNAPINITTDFRNISSQTIASFDTVLHNDHDYMAVTTTTLSSVCASPVASEAVVPGYKTSTYLFTDKNITTKLYNESFYTNYFTLSDIFVLPQEIVNSITFNKTTKKLIYNHYSLFENLNKKVYTYFTKANLGTSVVPAICTVNYHEFEKVSAFDNNDEFYIGLNEPLLTDVVNRPIELLYKQQEALFDFIKEEPINTDPPLSVNTRLPGDHEVTVSVVSLATNKIEVTAGAPAQLIVRRQNLGSVDNHTCSIHYYTALESALPSSIEFIDAGMPSTAVFEKGVTEIILEIDTAKFFAKNINGDIIKESEYNADPAAYNKTFTVKIAAGANCIIDDSPDLNSTIECLVVITPSLKKYNITLFGADSFTNPSDPSENFTARVGVKRVSPDGNYSLSAACNIFTNAVNWPSTMPWRPDVPVRNSYGIFSRDPNNIMLFDAYGDFPSIPDGTDSHEVSARWLDKTSTIFFMPGVSSIVFDLSAQNMAGGTNIGSDMSIDIQLHHCTNNATLDEDDTESAFDFKRTFLLEHYKPINLFLSGTDTTGTAMSANYRVDGLTTNNLLSCVNLWDFLNASSLNLLAENVNAFSAVSAEFAVSASFVLQDSVSVISTDDTLPALYFKPPSDFSFTFTNNQIDIIVPSNHSIVGKGGQGGHGLAVNRASMADGEAGIDFGGRDEPVEIGAWDEDLSIPITHTGVSGGPALSGFDSHFKQNIKITNNGTIYGGAGGGGGGVVAVSAVQMPEWVWPLWFGCGGGGGAGIHEKNAGAAGLAAVHYFTQLQLDPIQVATYYLQDGSAATGTDELGGVGGTWDITADGYPTITLKAELPVGHEDNSTASVIPAITDTVTNFPALTGKSGGSLGYAGESDSDATAPLRSMYEPIIPAAGAAWPGSYSHVKDNYKKRIGGVPGNIITSTVAPVTAGSGIFHGTGVYDPAT